MLSATICRPMEILLVEDGLLDARVTILALRRCKIHHRVTMVRSMDEARSFLNQESVFARAPSPDLILLDLLLPDGNGSELLQYLRSMPTVSDTPVVVLSAADDQEIRDRCSSLSIDDYITKPFNEEQFLRVVREHKRLMLFGASQAAPA